MEADHQKRASLVPNIREVTALVAAAALLAIPIRFGGPQDCDQPTQVPSPVRSNQAKSTTNKGA